MRVARESERAEIFHFAIERPLLKTTRDEKKIRRANATASAACPMGETRGRTRAGSEGPARCADERPPRTSTHLSLQKRAIPRHSRSFRLKESLKDRIFKRLISMSIFARVARLGRWRWATSVVLVGAACVPVLAATLLIPSEISAPWDGRTRRPEARGGAETGKGSSRPKRALRSARPFAPEPSPLGAPNQDEPAPSTPEPRNETGSAHGHFVPTGETDDSQPLVP